jgi:hypothetical protein
MGDSTETERSDQFTTEDKQSHPRLEAVAAEEYDGDDQCDDDECDSEADYHVQVKADGGGGEGVIALVCDSCSQENLLWVRANELLDNEVTV